MIDNRTSAGPRAWHPTYRIDHASPSGKKPVTVASISDAEREATPRARARRWELQARTDRRTQWVPEVRWEEKGGGVGGHRADEDRGGEVGGKGLSILEVRQGPEVGQEEYGGSVGGRRAGEDVGGKVRGRRPSTRGALGEKDRSRGGSALPPSTGNIRTGRGRHKVGGVGRNRTISIAKYI